MVSGIAIDCVDVPFCPVTVTVNNATRIAGVAYAGASESGKPHTYHIQGPTFLIEFLNVQKDGAGNPANHIHSCWRNLPGDFGMETK